MIEIINELGARWLRFFLIFELQNSIFILLLLTIIFTIKNLNGQFKKRLTVLGLIKTIIPPIMPALFVSSAAIVGKLSSTISIEPFQTPSIDASVAHSSAQLHLHGILFLVWFFGGLLFSAFMLRASLQLRKLLRKARPVNMKPGNLPARTSVFIHPNIKSPMVFGFLSPKIILPPYWETLSEKMKQSLLTHEINHIRNGDLYLNPLKILSLMLHYFNPLQWILLHYFELFTEMACDDATIKQTDLSRNEYNALIVQAAEAITLPGYINRGWGFSRAFKLLKQRIHYQLTQGEDRTMKTSKFFRLSVFLFLALLVLPLSYRCSTEQNENHEPKAAPTEATYSVVDANGVYAFFAVDKKPKMLKKVQPEYPEEARRKGIQGLVVVTVTIGENGKVIHAEPFSRILPMIDPDGNVIGKRAPKRYPELEPAAIAAALKCEFKPAEKDGHPVKVKMDVPFRFRLR